MADDFAASESNIIANAKWEGSYDTFGIIEPAAPAGEVFPAVYRLAAQLDRSIPSP